MSGLQSDPSWLEFLSNFSDLGYWSILLFVLIGTLLTVIIQASSATMAITIIMCNNGWIPFDCALAMVLGENIGTTITANLAAIIANTDAKRAAVAHLVFNVFGVVWMLIVFGWFEDMIISIVEWGGGLNPVEYAESRPIALSLFHSLFNITNTCLLVGFTATIARIVTRIVPQNDENVSSLKNLDRGMLSASQLSIVQVRNELVAYAQRSVKMFGFVRSLFAETKTDKFDLIYERIHRYENISDSVETEIYNYLSKTSEDSKGDMKSIQIMLKVVSDIERMADSNYRLAKYIKLKRDNKLSFTQELRGKVNQIFDLVERAQIVMNDNIEQSPTDVNKAMERVYELEREINKLRSDFRESYLVNIDKIELCHNSVVVCADIIAEAERLADSIVKVSEHTLNVELHSKPDSND
jgi:phosphate:Na+ symporter